MFKYIQEVEMELYKNYITEKYSVGMLSGVSIQCPENFNFGYDVVDYLGSADPDKRAMVWCD